MTPRLTDQAVNDYVVNLSDRPAPTPAAEFADLLTDLADYAEVDFAAVDAAEEGWLVEGGTTLLVADGRTGRNYLVTVQEVRE